MLSVFQPAGVEAAEVGCMVLVTLDPAPALPSLILAPVTASSDLCRGDPALDDFARGDRIHLHALATNSSSASALSPSATKRATMEITRAGEGHFEPDFDIHPSSTCRWKPEFQFPAGAYILETASEAENLPGAG